MTIMPEIVSVPPVAPDSVISVVGIWLDATCTSDVAIDADITDGADNCRATWTQILLTNCIEAVKETSQSLSPLACDGERGARTGNLPSPSDGLQSEARAVAREGTRFLESHQHTKSENNGTGQPEST